MMWFAMSASKSFPLYLVLLISMFSAPMLGASATGSGGDASSAIAGAEDAIASAYRAVLEAEGAGGDIRDLAARLNNACSLLVQAGFFYDAGNFDEAFRLTNLCVEISGNVVQEAVVLRDLALRQAEWNFRLTIALSLFSIALIAFISFFGWRAFKRRYYRRVLEMKPEVASIEP